MKKLFEVETLLDILMDDASGDYHKLEDEMIDKSRWKITNRLTFRDIRDGTYWQVLYDYGATEHQDLSPFEEDGNQIECWQVQPVTKEITVYEEV